MQFVCGIGRIVPKARSASCVLACPGKRSSQANMQSNVNDSIPLPFERLTEHTRAFSQDGRDFKLLGAFHAQIKLAYMPRLERRDHQGIVASCTFSKSFCSSLQAVRY